MLQGPTFPTRCLRGLARRARCRGASRPIALSLALAAALGPCGLGWAQDAGDTMVKEMAKDGMSKEMSKDMTMQAPATPREIIDRLIADPPAGAVAPQRRGVAAEPGNAPVQGTLDPGVVQIDPDAPLPRLRREGGFVVERSGRLVAVPDPSAAEQEGSELWIFDFDRVPGVDDLRPMIVQKTQRLQMMQEVRPVASTTGAGAPGRGRLIGHFLVTGQVHTHRGVNYLLPSAVTARPDAATAALLESARARRPAAPATATDGGGPRGVPAVTEDAFDSGGGTSASTFAGRDDPIRQMEALLIRPAGRPKTPGDPNAGPVAEGINPDTGAGAPVPAAPRQEGDYLVTRRGRVIGGGGGGPVLFAFSADGANADDAPVVLMPCGLLADLEDQARASNIAPEFALSGRIYAYRGVNHVLPTSYRTVPRRDNLGE